jgi:hypothetical protein
MFLIPTIVKPYQQASLLLVQIGMHHTTSNTEGN